MIVPAKGTFRSLIPARPSTPASREPKALLRDRQRQMPADQHAGNRAEQQPEEDAEVDVPGRPVRRARDVQERGRVEDVGADDLVRAQREDDQQRQPEEDAAADRRQADDEAAEGPDDDRGDTVSVRELPVRVAVGGRSSGRGSSR